MLLIFADVLTRHNLEATQALREVEVIKRKDSMPFARHRAMRLSSASAFDALLAPGAVGVVVHFVLFDLQLRRPAWICSDPLGSRVFSFAI